jgi:hypothetical protein
MSQISCNEVSELAPALALDAVEPGQREGLEGHVQRCPSCAHELSELHEVTTQFALALPQREPPASLGERIMAVAASDSAHRETSLRLSVSPSRWSRLCSPALSAVSLAAAIAALLWGAALQSQLGSAQHQATETSAQLERLRGAYNTVIDVLASPQTTVQDLQADETAAEAQGKVWIDHASGQGMMMARGLPGLSESQTYQVWLSNQAGRVSAGLLREYEDGVYYLVLRVPGKLTDYQRLGVTLEPIGGSPEPTGRRVIAGEI